jgi:adenylate kinase
MTVYLVMLGPPGAGKGTQAKKLSVKLNLPHVSTGDLFRANIKNETELGKLANSYIQKGDLVPDDVTIRMVRERLSQPDAENGAVLDGFPRTCGQAETLDEMMEEMGLKLTLVPYVLVPEEELLARLTGRWTCRECGHIYHTRYSQPEKEGVCDKDGAELYQRQDDKPETVRTRIQVFMEQTAPLIDYYRDAGLLVEINGNQTIERVQQDLLTAIGAVTEL